MGEERRITDLTAISAFRANDYIAVDNASEAQTKKLPASAITGAISAAQTDATRALNIARSTSSFPTGDAYSSSSAYKVGDMVIYNNTLYRCKTACSPASWSVNASNFEATSLASALTDVNNDLIALDNITVPTIDNNDYKFVWLRFNQTSDSAKAISLRGKVNGVAKYLTASDVYGAITFCCSENYNITHGWFINASNYWRSYTEQTNLSATYVVLALVRSNVNLTSEL